MMMTKRGFFHGALGVGVLSTAWALRYARQVDLVDAEGAQRAMQVAIGLALAAFANLMPKLPNHVRARVCSGRRAQSALRVAGWAMALAGIGYALLWVLVPLDVAGPLATAVVAAGTLVTVGCGAWAWQYSHGSKNHNASV